jgi:probable phosphoglycerate mutase
MARYDRAVGQIEEAGDDCAALFSHGSAMQVWCTTRILGFKHAIGNQLFLRNTGYVVADGSLADGYELVKVDGIRTDDAELGW